MKLKRFAAAALAFCLMLTLLPGGVSAATAASGDGWSLSANGVLTVTGEALNDSGSNWSKQASAITQVVIGRDVVNVSGSAFSECANLESFTVEQGNKAFYAGDDGVLYSADGQELVCYPAAHTGSYAGHSGLYMVPESVAKVCRNAFDGLINSKRTLKIYAYAGTIKSVGEYATDRKGHNFPDGMINTYIPVTGVSLNTGTLPLEVDDTAKLRATVLPEDATFQDVTWSSQIEEFATVTGSTVEGVNTGEVSGVSAGTVNIVVTTADGGHTASCIVTVVKKDVNGLELKPNPNPLVIAQNTTGKLTAEVTPYNATYRNISFISTDRSVVEIYSDKSVNVDSATGAVTVEAKADEPTTTASVTVDIIAKKPGTARIIVTTADGDYFAVCEATVPATEITSFTLEKELELTRAASGENREVSGTLTATVLPSDATYGAVSWYSSDTKVVTVKGNDDNTATLTTVKPGKAAVVARTADGKQRSCAVTVWDAPTGAGLSMTELTLAPNDTEQLYAVILPATADQKVTWSSSDETTVSVDENGLIKALKNGEATITATSDANEGIMKGCIVTVKTSVTDMTLSKTSLNLDESGDNTFDTLTAVLTPGGISEKKVTFLSTDPEVVKLSGGGSVGQTEVTVTARQDGAGDTASAGVTVTAVKPGKATVIAVTEDGKHSAMCTVTVNATIVTGVTLDKSAVTLGLDGEETLIATVMPAGAKNKKVTWSTSDETVATVSDSGGVTAAGKEGTAFITATTEEGGFTAQCTVTVQRNAVTRVKLDINQLELDLLTKPTAKLTATVEPAEATNQNVTWKSSDPDVAMVVDGTVAAVAPGSAVITVTTSDGDFTATCAVTVLPMKVTGITLGPTKITFQNENETADLTATLLPDNATDQTITFLSTDPTVAKLDFTGDGVKSETGAVTVKAMNGTAKVSVEAGKPGTATIIATTKDGGRTAQCTVTVYQPVETVSIRQGTDMTLNAGDTVTLTTIITPDNAPKSVKWSSSDKNVAEVGEDTGVVKAVAKGTARITATAADGKTATCDVTVLLPVTDIELLPASTTLELGNLEAAKTTTVAVKVTPSDASDTSVTWYSSNSDVAEVVNGTVTAKGPGTAAIIAVTNDGGKTASCTVTVRNTVEGVKLDQESLSLMKGTKAVLVATVEPFGTADQSVTWESGDPLKVKVTNGLIEAFDITEAGKPVTITATSVADKNKSATCEVTVTGTVVSVKGVSLDEHSLTLKKGDSKKLTPTLDPTNADNTAVEWKSTDEEVATVSGGTVTAKAAGSATIIVTTKDGGHMDWCTVTVQPVVESVTLNLNPPRMTVGLKDQKLRTLTATVAPYDAVDQNIVFEVLDRSVIDLAGGGNIRTVIPLKVGETTVTVKAGAGDGIKTATCTVKVNDEELNYAELSEQSLSLTENGTSHTLTVTVKENGASIDITGFTTVWSSSDEAVATVSGGTVKPEDAGTALITASVTDDKAGRVYTASCVVTVKPVAVTGITPDGNPFFTLSVGGKKSLNPVIAPGNATNQKVLWYSSDGGVAEVTNGEVTAKTPGTAGIVAVTEDGGFAASYTVTVTGTVTEATGLTLNNTALSLVYIEGKPESATLTAKFAGEAASGVDWSSSDDNVVKVDKDSGEVTAAGKGTATITATLTRDNGKEFTATCFVTVRAAITKLELSPESVTLELNGADGAKTTTLTATVTPSGASDTSVTWHSSNLAVAKVDNGTVTAENPGTAVIVAATADGSHVKSCTVTVRNQINTITLNKDTLTLTKDEEEMLVAFVNEGADPRVTWRSEDDDIATVNDHGVVTAVGEGDTKIVAESVDNSGVNAKCAVTVKALTTPVTGVELNPTELTLKAAQGDDPAQSKTLKATVKPNGASDPGVTWMSTDENVVKVNPKTGSETTVTAVAPGKATIIVTTDDGRYTDMCTITVPAPEVEITLDTKELTMYVGNNNVSLNATVKPFTAAYASLNWFTSDDDVATVSNTGAIKAEGPGTAVITVATPDGKYSASCVVTVWNKITSLELNKKLLILAEGDSWPLRALLKNGVNPEGVIWTSTDETETVVKIENGIVTAVGAGEASITAAVSNDAAGEGGPFRAVCTVKVSEYSVSSGIEAPAMTISDGEGGKTVTLSVTTGDDIYYMMGDGTEYKPYTSQITVETNTTIKAYAVRGSYQSVVVTGIVNVTGSPNHMILTDKMGNTIESLAEAKEEDLSFTANITLSDEVAESAANIYIAFYDKKGALISLEKFELESGETEGEEETEETEGTDDQVISQYFKLKIPADATIGSIKLMVLSGNKTPLIDAGNLDG